jgi:dolichol-phosphate mannosyltransferase
VKSENLIIIPTYNERENIEKMVRKVMSIDRGYDLLIIDDGSPDGTGGIVKALQHEFDGRLHLLERSGKLGLGTAYILGFRYALDRGYQYIFEMDCDFSHNPDDLPRLEDACRAEGADLSIGSRYITGVNVVNWPMSRVLMSYFASAYVRRITGMKIRDTTAGFKCYKRQVLETIELDKISFMGYAFQIEMKFTTWKCGFSIKEVPIIFYDRTEGKSKMSGKIFREAIIGVIEMKVKSWFRKFPKNIRTASTEA